LEAEEEEKNETVNSILSSSVDSHRDTLIKHVQSEADEKTFSKENYF
jgi:hypothetical protein